MGELILKEDALNCFHDWIDRYGYEHTADEDQVYQRIEALDTVRCCDEDYISRRVAIEAIDEWFKKVRQMMSAYEYDSAYAQGEIDAYVTAIDTLKTLPTVQPDHTVDVSKKVGKEDCVSRRAAIDALDIAIERYDEMAEEYRKKADIERNDYMDMRDDAYEARQLAQWLNELKHLRGKIEQLIMRLPSAKQEIIDCFECTHYKPISNSWGKCYIHSSSTERFRTCQSCDYCSWAERRQDD